MSDDTRMDNYDREERIAIRMDSGMSDEEAVRLTDEEIENGSVADKS